MPNTVVKTSLIEGEAIKTIIHKHRLSELINVVDSFSASVDGMVRECLQSDWMVKRYERCKRAMRNYLFVKGEFVACCSAYTTCRIALRFTMIGEAWAKSIQNTIAESTRSVVPASNGIATLQSTACTHTQTHAYMYSQYVININLER